MPSLSRIILPVDFSERSAGAARYARTIARHFGAELTLLHILTPPQYEFGALDIGGSMLTELYRNQANLASREMEAFLASEMAEVNVRRVVIEGDPARKIVEYAQQEHADLIVMPTHGYGPFRRFILGSNTAKVLHDADCPVWTGVHLQEAPAIATIPFRNVLCAVDLGPQSAKALCWAALLARGFGARLILMHAATPEPDPGDSPEVSWHIDVLAAARQEMLRLLESTGVEAEVAVESGEPSKSICAVAARVGADVLVIGRGSAAGVFGRLRANAYTIIRESPCPVVSV